MIKFEDLPPMRKDGIVKEVIGSVDAIYLKDKSLIIKTKTGGKYTFKMNSISLRQLISLAKIPSDEFGIKNGQKNLLGSDFNRLDVAQQKKVLSLIIDKVDNVLFRARIKYGEWLCFAVLSQKYNKIKADDLNKKVKEIYKNMRIDLDESNGYFAGSLYINFPAQKGDIVRVVVALGAQKLDGYNSNKVIGQATIIKSGFNLIFDPTDNAKFIAKIEDDDDSNEKLYVKEYKDDKLLKSKIDKVADTVRGIIENIPFTKKMELSHDEQVTIGLCYTRLKMLCKRNWVKIAKVLFGDVEIDEGSVLPKTNLWDYINAYLTVANKGESIKKGVKTNLERIGGELLILAPHWEQFMTVAKAKIPKI